MNSNSWLPCTYVLHPKKLEQSSPWGSQMNSKRLFRRKVFHQMKWRSHHPTLSTKDRNLYSLWLPIIIFIISFLKLHSIQHLSVFSFLSLSTLLSSCYCFLFLYFRSLFILSSSFFVLANAVLEISSKLCI
jgi:hypothetical protein